MARGDGMSMERYGQDDASGWEEMGKEESLGQCLLPDDIYNMDQPRYGRTSVPTIPVYKDPRSPPSTQPHRLVYTLRQTV